ncbi:RNA ligase family protein [Streptomyces nanshensis]|uniref:RNA ligase domain-containing protein n=1 Tax=Streptomyces nanshensis TaxID=518642 RepID=A0A1E7LCB1_9ACTN|nr:RNA ligase family protein [Streptomyces nanshensis]OEV13808.1 hypothetical protein AN218_01875 [Streptomyces nanshensis]
MSEQGPRYPRTPHLPNSPGVTADDLRGDWADFAPRSDAFVATLKMDGENTTLHRRGMYARSPDGRSRPWQDRMRALAAGVCPDIPEGWLVCGENLTVPHSIRYSRPVPPFAVFSIWEADTCLSWDDTREWAELLDLPTVPVIYRGHRPTLDGLHQAFEEYTDTEHDEGYVIRDAGSFEREDFAHRVAKWVRSGHVRTDDAWPARSA